MSNAQEISSRSSTRRRVIKTIPALPTQDGAGVALFRAIGQPALGELDPFLLLDEMHSDQPDDYVAGFPAHPHRGFETLSYMISGEMRHQDSHGNVGVVGSGGAQWMRAAGGIVHSETPAQEAGLLWGFQLWINLPATEKMKPASYLDIPARQIPVVNAGRGTVIRVIAGRGIAESPGPVIRNDIELMMLDISLAPDTQHIQPVPSGHSSFAYVCDGAIRFAPANDGTDGTIPTRSVVVFADGDHIVLGTGAQPGRLLLLSGKPIGEPIVRHGPFVMNSKGEIRQAIADYRNGVLK